MGIEGDVGIEMEMERSGCADRESKVTNREPIDSVYLASPIFRTPGLTRPLKTSFACSRAPHPYFVSFQHVTIRSVRV